MKLVTLITPTGDRKDALKLCVRWMASQDYRGAVQWLVTDDGRIPGIPDMPRIARRGWNVRHVVRPPSATPIESFTSNLLAGTALSDGDVILFIEDDDYYRPDHVSEMVRRLHTADAVGNSMQRYYHIALRQWFERPNVGATLSQTGLRREALPLLEKAIHVSRGRNDRGVDGQFWRSVQVRNVRHDLFTDPITCIGMKGLPGRAGLGVGHNPTPRQPWSSDLHGKKLDEWVGADAKFYKAMEPVA